MKRSSLFKLASVLFISIAVLVVWLGSGTEQAAAATDLTALNAADFSPYRWESSASYYASHQVWPDNLTSFNAADISAYRWNAMAGFYASHQVWLTNLTTLNAADISAYRWNAMASFYAAHPGANNSNGRLMMIEPGFWARQAALLH